ncbi:HNH endonuclease [Ornithinimicrobium kibberense]|uniref:HNH endonuclease n=1 Tax=Ornithinimicrobium kibberense TaxID=282060 RepID=A0ABV5V6V8_9MICO|nr:HNH endonuclease signature motif containing protein [Ornithinimicrobium kibberense]
MTSTDGERYKKHAFTAAERFAVFNTHGDRCYLGGELLTATTFEVDHILPEALLQTPPELQKVLSAFDLPADFNLNDFGNWLPACRPCNGRKRKQVFRPTPIVQLEIDRARSKAEGARRRAQRAVSERDLANAVAKLAKAHEMTHLPEGYEDLAVATMILAKAHASGSLPKAYQELARKAKEVVSVPDNFEVWAAPVIDDYVAEHAASASREVLSETEAGVDPSPRLHLTPSQSVPLFEVLSDDGRRATVRGPYGVGGGPSLQSNPGPGAACWSCGLPFWNGTRCVACGAQNDGD